jgi:hypothetical protein
MRRLVRLISRLSQKGELHSIDLQIKFLSTRLDGKLVTSAIMTLRGEVAQGKWQVESSGRHDGLEGLVVLRLERSGAARSS